MEIRFDIPEFRPHPLFRNPHAQTLAGNFLPGGRYRYGAVRHRVGLPDGDTIVLHDDSPAEWSAGQRVALLLHGLAGSHTSGYMVRAAAKLNHAGVRSFRMDLRGCGAGAGLTSRPYHGGRSDDAREALQFLAQHCPGSPLTLVGFSLSGNIVLKLLGEEPDRVPANVEKAAAICPAVNLELCARSLVGRFGKRYDRHFVRLLCRQIRVNRRLRPDLPAVEQERRLRTMLAFDDAYTAPVCGFESGAHYYETSSAARHIAQIRVPTLILTAKDDPLVPFACFDGLRLPPNVLFHATDHGGHLGYLGQPSTDPDRRWMDWRIVDWTTAEVNSDVLPGATGLRRAQSSRGSFESPVPAHTRAAQRNYVDRDGEEFTSPGSP